MPEAARRKLIFIVDDDASVRDSLAALLKAHGFQSAVFRSAEEFLAHADFSLGLCALIDLRMDGMSGLELQAALAERGIDVPVAILTGHGDIPLAVEAMRAGAIDFIEKPGSEGQILGAIETASNHVARRPQPTIPPQVVAERLSRLTVREREVLDHLVLGMTNKSIAGKLGISQRTVEIHRARIREKLEARGLADLIRMMR